MSPRGEGVVVTCRIILVVNNNELFSSNLFTALLPYIWLCHHIGDVLLSF